MSFELVKFPSVNIQPGFVSKWNCVHHPISYTGFRKDAKIVNFISGSPAPQTTCVVNAVPAGLVVGSEVYFSSDDGLKVGTGTVQAIIGQVVKLNKTTSFNFTSGYLNLLSRKQYYIEVKVYGVNASNNWTHIGTLELKPDTTGKIEISINSMLKKLLKFGDPFSYSVINRKFPEMGGRFNITYREIWKGYEGTFTSINGFSSFFWINATKQLRDPHNFNAGELTLFPTTIYGKFASAFDVPTYFKGYPFSTTFIWSDNVSGKKLNRVEEKFDVNGVSGGTTVDTLDPSQNASVNFLKLKEGYANSVDHIDLWLETDGDQEIGYVLPGYVAGGYVKTITAVIPPRKIV